MSNGVFETLLESLPDAVFVKDGEGRWLLANEVALRLFGLNGQAYQGKSDLELAELVPWYREALQYCKQSDELAWQSRKLSRGDEMIQPREGPAFVFDVLKSPLFYEDGSRRFLVIIGRDITARMKMERELAESETQYRTIADFTFDWEYWMGPDGRLRYMSPSCERITGYSAADFFSRPGLILEIGHPDDRQKIKDHLLSVVEDRRDDPLALHYRIVRPDGETRWMEHHCQPVYSQSGEWLGRRGSNRDITERKTAELQLNQALHDLQKSKEERGRLERFFSRDILDHVLERKIEDKLGGNRQFATIVFFDLRGSTAIAEKLDPGVFAEFLSMIHTDIMDLVYGNHGSVNKLIGDGILATFGVPSSAGNDALNAARCAVQIREYMKVFNEVRPDYLTAPVEFGIGIASGEVFAGNTGSVRRMEYTVLGDAVNLAARLDSIAKAARVDIIIDGTTRNLLSEHVRVQRVRLDRVRGRMQKVEIFFLRDLLEKEAADTANCVAFIDGANRP